MKFYVVLLLTGLVGCYAVPLSQTLWEQTEAEREAALNTTYILGIQNGNLDPTEFGVYNLQDIAYCFHTKRAIDIATARTSDITIQSFLKETSASYASYATALRKEWHVKWSETITLGPACENYINHLYDVAKTQDPANLVVAITPCAKLWPWIGEQLNVTTGNFGVYTKWAQGAFNPSYKGYLKYDAVIDWADSRGLINEIQAQNVYKQSVNDEVAFFSL